MTATETERAFFDGVVAEQGEIHSFAAAGWRGKKKRRASPQATDVSHPLPAERRFTLRRIPAVS